MASSPPYNGSPPAPASLVLPRQRPMVNTGLALPTNPPNPRRKPSTASATSATHPLRQTSFPPSSRVANGSGVYSPEGSADFSDTEIASAISGPSGPADGEVGGKKRKRAEKKTRGRPPKNPRAGSVDDTRSAVNQRANTAGADAEAEDNEDEDEDDPTGTRGNTARENEILAERNTLDKDLVLIINNKEREWQFAHHTNWKRAKLRVPDVRKLVNQTLSQSVPANVVTVVNAYTKMFAEMLVESARDVQDEWLAVEEKRPDGKENHVAKKLRGEEDGDASGGAERTIISSTQTNGHACSDDTQPDAEMHNMGDGAPVTNGHQAEAEEYDDGAMNLRRQIEQDDRGPLLPDHLREALRRYKKSRHGGTVGFTGLSLEGKDVAAARMGGRRLFR